MKEMTSEERVELTQAIIGILDSWGLRDSEQIAVLGLPEGTPTRVIRKYRMDTALPEDPEIDCRIEHIVGIADALRTTFPMSRNMGIMWMRRRNRKFRQRSPLDCMVEDGLLGVIQVRSHLDCSYAWRTSA